MATPSGGAGPRTPSGGAGPRTPSGGDEPGDGERTPDPPLPARRVRRHRGPDQPAGRWDRPDSERDEIWGDAPPDAAEQLRRDVPPHHGG